MTPWDKVRRESMEIPRVRLGSPLPWMLMFVSLALAITVLIVGRSRLSDERERSAAALKANDEVHAKLKAAQADVQKAQDACKETEASKAELSKRVIGLDLQNRKLADELAKAKAAAKK